jgi:hypothetical protein
MKHVTTTPLVIAAISGFALFGIVDAAHARTFQCAAGAEEPHADSQTR